MKQAKKDWTRTGTIAGYAEYLRSQSKAFAVIVIRRDDGVIAADHDIAPRDVQMLVEEHLSRLVGDLDRARKEKQPAARMQLDPPQE